MNKALLFITLSTALYSAAQEPTSVRLSGDIMSSTPASDAYAPANAFDSDLSTHFEGADYSFAWVGLDLGKPHIITQLGFAPDNSEAGPDNMLLGVFQGANNEDFSDALPIYMIKEKPTGGEVNYGYTDCSLGFRYVRYVSPSIKYCKVADLEFYGYAATGDSTNLYQPTNLPTVVVNTPGMEWFDYTDITHELNGSTVMIIDNGTLDLNAIAQIRGRGNASWNFPKKPFRIKFESKQKVLGGPAKAKKWVMINNYGDKTLMRNRLAFDISERLGLDFTPTCHFVDLIFNGEYGGTYQLGDQITVNKHRVNITEMTEQDVEGEALTGGYLIELDAYSYKEEPSQVFNTSRGYTIPVTIKSPDHVVPAQYDYISEKLNQLTERVKSDKYTDPKEGYKALLDIDSFIKHFIVGEVAGSPDTYWSVYMSLGRGEDKFKVGPVWDFDLGFDNDRRIFPVNSKPSFIYNYGSSAGETSEMVARILSDPEVKERLSYIWSYARKYQGLDTDTFVDLVTKYSEELDASQTINFIRWPILDMVVHENPKTRYTYENEVSVLKDYFKGRFDVLDSFIGLVEVENGITDESVDTDTDFRYYNLQGIFMGTNASALAPGIYLRRTGASSILIKL